MVEYVFEKKRLNILFFYACGFKEVSYLLLNNMNGLSTDCNIFSTAIVNGMLAAELFLKHIKAYDDAVNNNLNTCFLKTHDIDLLFNDLSKKRQIEIIKRLKKYGCDTKSFYRFRMRIKRARLEAKNQQNTNKGKNTDVINWRYLVVDSKNSYRFDLNIMTKLNESLYSISQQILNSQNSGACIPNMKSPILDSVSEKIVDELYITQIKPKEYSQINSFL